MVDIESASRRISKIVRKTSLFHSNTFSKMFDKDIFFKCENLQKTGSFKIRGAANKISNLKNKIDKESIFIAASAGNHAQGVAYAANYFGFNSTIVMPKYAPLAKIEATRGYGANVELVGECFDEANEYAKNLDGIYIHPYEDLDVIAGQGTVGLEILNELSDVDIVLVPAGGGGLLAGVAFAVKHVNPKIKVIGVQAENSNAIALSFKEKKLISTENSSTIADGIAVKNPGKVNIDIINHYVDDVITVSDYDIASAVLFLIERSKIVVEPAGAASAAALLNMEGMYRGKKIVCILSGGNIDVNTISNIIERGLAARFRKVELILKVPDHPSSVKNVLQILLSFGANVMGISVDRYSLEDNVDYQNVYICIEINGEEHYTNICNTFKKLGYLQ